MDKRTDNVLQEIKTTTHFLGGVRLPDTAFKKIAGTRVTTDLLFFQRIKQRNLMRRNLSLVALFPLKMISVSGSILILMGNTIRKFLGEYEVRNFNGGTLNVKGVSDTLATDIMESIRECGST